LERAAGDSRQFHAHPAELRGDGVRICHRLESADAANIRLAGDTVESKDLLVKLRE
jgi:hypothetical protein